MSKLNFFIYLVILILLVVPLYPKFPLVGVGGTFVAIRLEDFLVAFVVGAWLLANLARWRQVWAQPINKSVFWYWVAGAIAVFSAVFVTKTADLNQGLWHFLRRVEYMSLFLVAYSALETKEQLGWIVRTFLVVALTVAVYGVGQLLFNFPVISTTNSEFSKGLALSLGPGARINSTFAGHYDLAAFSLFPLLLIVGLLTLPIRGKSVLVAIGTMGYWVMLLSASRVTFAALFLGTALFLWLVKKRVWLVAWVVIAAASVWLSPQLVGRYKELIINHVFTAITVAYAQVDEELPDALKPPAIPEDRSLNIRLKAEWPKALRSIAKNPVLGTGYSSVGLAVDNDYLRSLAETGLLGTVALGLVFARVFKSLWPKSKPITLPGVFSLAIACAVVGLLLNAVFIDVFEASKVAIVTWIMLGLAVKSKSLSAS